MLSKNEIIEIYGKIITDYLLLMDQSETIKNLTSMQNYVYHGMNTIHHIFALLVISNTPLDNVVIFCQKACFSYLEYIEQINKSHLLNNLDIKDVMTFVYKKILNENILEEQENTKKDGEIIHILDLLKDVNRVIMSWKNDISLKVRVVISDIYIREYTRIFLNKKIDIVFLYYLETIQQKTKMDETVYYVLLNGYSKHLQKLASKHSLPSSSNVKLSMLMMQDYIVRDEDEVDNFVNILFDI